MIQETVIDTSINHNYHLTKYNAIKHGVSSKLDVLPWEGADDLENLKQGFVDDLNPQGATEMQLVLDLAVLSFKKHRIYKAENAVILNNLSTVGDYSLKKGANLLCKNIDVEKSAPNIKEALYPDIKDDAEVLKFFNKL